jgi:hypothetical protein
MRWCASPKRSPSPPDPSPLPPSHTPRFASLYRIRPPYTGGLPGKPGTPPELIATGVRNSVGFDWHPSNGLYFTDNGRDGGRCWAFRPDGVPLAACGIGSRPGVPRSGPPRTPPSRRAAPAPSFQKHRPRPAPPKPRPYPPPPPPDIGGKDQSKTNNSPDCELNYFGPTTAKTLPPKFFGCARRRRVGPAAPE